MKDVTVLILTKDDEDVIADAIKSCHGFAKEVIVIDANSNDKTEKIASKLEAKVLKHPFKDFSDQRNFAILHATTEWVLYLDSDERLTPDFIGETENIIDNYDPLGSVGGYYITRKTYYYGRDWKMVDRMQRLFYRKRLLEWKGVVHETPVVKGEFGQINSPILHFTHRNLSQMLRKTNEWSEFEAKLRWSNNHPPLAPWRFLRVMITEFVNSYIKNKGYKNGTLGFIEAMYQAYSIFITYAKLWEMQQKQQKRD